MADTLLAPCRLSVGRGGGGGVGRQDAGFSSGAHSHGWGEIGLVEEEENFLYSWRKTCQATEF